MRAISRKRLEGMRDCFNAGHKVIVIKNTWDRPNTIGKKGVVASYSGYDQFTPNVPVLVEGFYGTLTFSPDDIKSLEPDAPEYVRFKETE
jgi:hypothetical protein